MGIDEVEDIETLRRAAKVLESENLVMSKMILKLKRELHEMKHGKAEQLELQIAELEEQLARRNKMLFGKKSEKRGDNKENACEKQQQTGHGRREQPELEEVEQVHTADIDDESCELCGGKLEESAGFVEESEEIDIIERRFVITKHKRQKYKCKCGSCIVTAPAPRKLFDGARYSIGFAIHVAMAKYADHLPLTRQVTGMKRDGLICDSQTLWDQISRLASYLEPAHMRLKTFVLNQPSIGADETHWKLMGEKGKKKGGAGKRWQAWAIVSPQAVHYSFEDSRSAETAENILDGYEGVVLTDGYAAYEAVKKRGGKFTLAHCWAHVRRKFVEIEDTHPGRCQEVLDLIGKLYQVEKEAKARPPDEVLALRREFSKPLILAIQKWSLEVEALPESTLGKAIRYMGGLWGGLRVFLDNPLVGLDNNPSERSLRSVVLGRKNHYGSRSVRGTQVAALFYSLIESAKLAGMPPQKYLHEAINSALDGREIPLPHELA